MNLGILRIEMRRSIGAVMWPVMIMLGAWLAVSELPQGIWLWPSTSYVMRETLEFLGPLIAALAAWVAGRNRRCRMNELLATTPQSASIRDLSVWGGTAVWGLLAYLGVAVGLIVMTAQQATWGGPVWAPIIQGALGISTYAALGYAVGCYIPSRFTAPLVAMGMYVVQHLPLFWDGSEQYLAPFRLDVPTVYYPIEPNLDWPKALWLGGLTAVGLAAVVLKERRTFARWSALLLALFTTVSGVVLVVHMAPSGLERPTITPYTLVCATDQIEVCVHPAYKAVLPDTVAMATAVVRPLLGIPGGPTRVEQQVWGGELLSDGTLTFNFAHESRYDYLPFYLADTLVRDMEAMVSDPNFEMSYQHGAQVVIQEWLEQQAGVENTSDLPLDAVHQAALDRFTALDTQTQRQWLETHYAALRVGELTLEDLP